MTLKRIELEFWNQNYGEAEDYTKFNEVTESLKNIKDRKDVQRYIAEYVTPHIIIAADTTIPNLLTMLDVKYLKMILRKFKLIFKSWLT